MYNWIDAVGIAAIVSLILAMLLLFYALAVPEVHSVPRAKTRTAAEP
jgi:hypothetical protein